MDIGKSFTFITEDEKWLEKLGLGALISAVPVLNFAWTGFMLNVMRNVSEDVAKPLPDWSDLGDKFIKGLVVTLAGLIYALPAILAGCLLSGLAFVPLFVVTSGQGEQGANPEMAIGTTALLIVMGCCIGLYGLLLSFIFPAVMIHYSRQETFGSCFQFSQIMPLVTANLSAYVTAWAVSIAASFVVGLVVGAAGMLVVLIPCVGWLVGWALGAVASAYLGAVYAHLFGQVGANPVLDLSQL